MKMLKLSENYQISMDPKIAREFSEKMERFQQEITEKAIIIVDQYKKSFEKIAPLIGEFPKIIKYLEEAPGAMKKLADVGWYIPIELSIGDITVLGEKIDGGKIDDIDKFFIQEIDKELITIKTDLLNKFSHRSEPLSAAFDAHENRNYYLSIPVLFAQTDGICKELTGKTFFNAKMDKETKEYLPETNKWAEQFQSNSIMNILVEPFKHKGDFSKHFTEENFSGITRHSVLHGDNSTYGTKLNSYKAIALLSYIGGIVFEIAKKLEEFNK